MGVFKNGRVEIIANDKDSRATPSCIAFADSERMVGEDAKNSNAIDPENIVYGESTRP